jgi:hypothetical protein
MVEGVRARAARLGRKPARAGARGIAARMIALNLVFKRARGRVRSRCGCVGSLRGARGPGGGRDQRGVDGLRAEVSGPRAAD